MKAYPSEVRVKPLPLRCYGLMLAIVFCLIVGLYFTIQAYKDPKSKELKELDGVISNWNDYFPFFNTSQLSISSTEINSTLMTANNTKDNLSGFPKYKALFFSTHLKPSKYFTEMKIIYKNSEEYNVTSDFYIDLVNEQTKRTIQLLNLPVHMRKVYTANEKICRNAGKGYWNRTAGLCYYHYNTKEICLVVSEDLELESWYEQGCNSESYLTFITLISTTEEPYTYLNHSIYFQVRSTKDPYIYANYNSLTTLSQSSSEYAAIGIIFLCISTLFIIIIILYTIIRRHKSRYQQMNPSDSNFA